MYYCIRVRQKHVNLSDEFCEGEGFPYLLTTSKFDYNAPKDIPVSQSSYFNQRLWAATLSSINFARNKIKSGKLTAGKPQNAVCWPKTGRTLIYY